MTIIQIPSKMDRHLDPGIQAKTGIASGNTILIFIDVEPYTFLCLVDLLESPFFFSVISRYRDHIYCNLLFCFKLIQHLDFKSFIILPLWFDFMNTCSFLLRDLHVMCVFPWETLRLCCLPAVRNNSCENTRGAPVLRSPPWNITSLDYTEMIQTCSTNTAPKHSHNEDMTAQRLPSYYFQTPSWKSTSLTPTKSQRTAHLAVFLLPLMVTCWQPVEWNSNEALLYLLVKGSSLLTITESVNRKYYWSHKPCKQTRSTKPWDWKQEWIGRGLEGQENKE